ncbi:Trk system potassium transporter TrkA [Rhodocaloribacter litoris]|uniref:Trk system potassium transporter TrkA n=1 Tax=Rhodocaloribacter litoris TaxID=2558931 RepID=UPI001424128C|nr:Trk system potassium transporter TrkA [Rhodocaloribacter litoris]QXD15038.1 Trk system potassium transporter TrkA [Rhodocaloribacter litoris]
MKVVVVGAGEVGFDVARLLAMEQHDVVVIDVDPDVLENVRDKLDVMTIQGSGTSARVLTEAGVRGADMLIAVTTSDEVNVIACMMADRLGVRTTMARIRSDELTGTETVLSASDLGIDIAIHPEESAAAEVVRLIRRASATDVLTFAGGRLHLVGIRLDADAPVIGKSLRELAASLPGITFRVMAIVRGIRTLLPGGDEVLRKNDQVFVLAPPKYMPPLIRAMGKSEHRLEHVMILGGTKVGAKVASMLQDVKGMRLKLIEPDRERAEQLAEALSGCLVLHGQSTDIDLLVAEGLGEMDAFVAVTGDEESNLVTCLLAKHLGVRKTVALLSKGAYIPISQSIGLDAAVSTKLAVSREIMRFLRGKHVLSVATVHGMDAEVLELKAAPRAPITRAPLREMKLPRGVLLGAVDHGDRVEIATGHTQLQPGDRAYVFVLPERVRDVERLFARP